LKVLATLLLYENQIEKQSSVILFQGIYILQKIILLKMNKEVMSDEVGASNATTIANTVESVDMFNIVWDGVIDIGHKVELEENWIDNPWQSRSGFEYHNGYVCVRKITNNEKTYKLNCSIESSALKIPLFSCSLEFDDIKQKFLAKTPSGVMRKAFKYIGFEPKRTWNGNEFYGLHRKDVQSLLAIAHKQFLVIDANNNDPEIENLSIKNSKSSTAWVHVISPGDSQSKEFIHVGKKKLWTPVGYEALRKVKVGEKWINLFCKVGRNNLNSDNSLKFTCYTNEEPVISCWSTSISQCVSATLKRLNIKSTRRWSGVDFFGLSRSDVSQYIESNMKNGSGRENKKHCSLPELLTNVANTKHRNAGPTSSLCEKSQKQRNELIHELVNLVSAGDVKGKR